MDDDAEETMERETSMETHENETLSPIDIERKRRETELADKRFNREEMGELLRMFSALGITVALGITGFFLCGLYLDRWLGGLGWKTYGLPRIGGVLAGLGLTMYWAYLRITRHLAKYDKKREKEK